MKWFDLLKNEIDYDRFNEVLHLHYESMVNDFLESIPVKKITYAENVDSKNRSAELREAYWSYGKKGEYYGKFLQDNDLDRFELDAGQKSKHSYTKLSLKVSYKDSKIVGNKFSVDLKITPREPLPSVSDAEIGFITITWPHVDIKEYVKNRQKRVKLIESYSKDSKITLEHIQDTLFLEELMGYAQNGIEIFTLLKRRTRNLYKRAYRKAFDIVSKEAKENV